ncbi:MAG: Txe/YoeB family addiction module toxin [Flavobacteriaceae bacterium]|jgi:toxin YoeB|nr:Txe/YoeB family addiction module toxin [Flavobacteriaceae bacterium]
MKRYKLIRTPDFEKDVEKLRKFGNIKALKKLAALLLELTEHPTIGTGKPEPLLGDRAGQWSRRISGKHRLIYMIDNEKVIVLLLSAYGHYNDN